MQEPFVEATREIIGGHSCYPLLAIEKLKEKAAWQLYAGANNVKPSIANEISKHIEKYNEKLKYAEEEDKEFINIEDFIPPEFIDIYKESLDYQGITINGKAHACGYMMFDGDIRREVGLVRMVSETTGKSVLCAAMEGNYLDEFGYVKNDYLIVDSVHLTYKLFESIGMKVPTFDELREMIKGDSKVWDIYKRGITCCVNQVEKASTTMKVMQYKPQNLAELSAFIAAIRPGFKSLINIFLAREPYSTGEKAIDELLEDSYHFMLYQESLMKLLSFLGVPMTDSYGVIKSISKKKLKGKKLEELQNTLMSNWEELINNLDNFENIWRVFEDSTRYAFNSPHSLSMGGDSAYEAWFKAHHTSKFYEIAINHYQDKNKKDKIDALVKEAIEFFGYNLGKYEFGKDNRRVNIDEANLTIYPNLSSVKGIGEHVAETLYHMGLEEYESFMEFLDKLQGKGINKTVLTSLIKINYFKKFGEAKYLLNVMKYYYEFAGSKEIFKTKIEEIGLDINFVAKYGNETAKKVTKLDVQQLLKDIISNVPNKPLSIKENMDSQREILGITTHVDDSFSDRIFYISELEVLKSITNIKVYRVCDGKSQQLKMWSNSYNKNPFQLGDFLYLNKIDKKPKKKFNGEIDPITGKRIYIDIEGQHEYWLEKYKIITDEVLEYD